MEMSDFIEYVWVYCETCEEEYQVPADEDLKCPICLENVEEI